MIKKLTSKAGMTLIEMMASLLIMVLLVAGMNTGMTAGLRVYEDATLETTRTMLASNINTKLTDILRYADVKDYSGANQQDFVITNLEYGLLDVNFQCLQSESENDEGILQIYFWDRNGKQMVQKKKLISKDAYENLKIQDFQMEYNQDTRGGYFTFEYSLLTDAEISGEATAEEAANRKFEAVVRIMND